MKTLTHGLLALVLACLGLQNLSFAQAPIVLSSADAPLVFELPLDPSTTQSLTESTAVQLATRGQHHAQGMVYPAWLSDAAFSVTHRSRQRLAIVVTPKRGNPELSTELLLTLNNAGKRSLKPLHLMFDTVSRFQGTPVADAVAAESVASAPDTKSALPAPSAPVIRFEGEPASAQRPSGAIATPVPDRASSNANTTNTKTQGARTNAQRQRSAANQPTVGGAKPSLQAAAQTPAPASPAPSPATAPALAASAAPAAAPIAPPATPPALPTRSTRPMPAPAPQPQSDSWLSDWPMLLGALALLLVLAFAIRRALQSWRTRRADRVQTNFLEPKPTALAPEEIGTNTVFGVSDEEASAMHAKWLREQTAKRIS